MLTLQERCAKGHIACPHRSCKACKQHFKEKRNETSARQQKQERQQIPAQHEANEKSEPRTAAATRRLPLVDDDAF